MAFDEAALDRLIEESQNLQSDATHPSRDTQPDALVASRMSSGLAQILTTSRGADTDSSRDAGPLRAW